VLWDPLHFGGGNTSFEALALGAPIVTLPGQFMRGRVTHGCYQQLGVLDCVAESTEQYVQLAVRLGTEPEWREAVRAKLVERKAQLFDTLEPVRELEDFLRRAVAEAAV
jgi:predicted O-linked N-acetylglucosamine transferase (SPINDLY family)